MAVDIFSTRFMLTMLEQMLPARSFLLDTFFSSTEMSNTAYVDIDIMKGSRKMAPFVSPVAEGKLVEKRGYTTKSYQPPYLKPKFVTTAADILKRAPGQHIYAGNMSPTEKAAEQLGKDLFEADELVTRREEWMGAQALNGGVITVSGEGFEDSIDFQMRPEHKITLAGADRWTEAGSTPLEDFRAWRDLVAQACGLIPNVAVCGQSVINALLAHEDFRNQLDTRRIDLGSIDPQMLADQGAVYYGRIKDCGIDLYTYSEWYQDDAGTTHAMVPENKIFMGATGARTARHYGAIQDLDFGGSASVRMFPKSWREKDPSAQILLVQSAPLVVPHQIDAFATIQPVD